MLTCDPIPSIVFFCTSQVNGALTDLVFVQGGLAVAVGVDPECDVYKQIEVVVNDSLLSQEYKMELIKTA